MGVSVTKIRRKSRTKPTTMNIINTLTGQNPESHTAGHKAVENNLPISGKVPHDSPNGLGTQVVAKCSEGLVQLSSINVARSVTIKSIERVLHN